jgi:hypothetical protein
VGDRRLYWGATAGAGLGGAGACLALAQLDLLAPSGIVAAALLYWLARRVVAVVPSATPRPRVELHAWSPYDRRRSGRVPLGRRILRQLRVGRRRGPAPTLTPEDALLRGLRPAARRSPRPDRPPTRWHERDVL